MSGVFTRADPKIPVPYGAWLGYALLLLYASLHSGLVFGQDTGAATGSVMYAPSGKRLRDLADRLDFQIGYAARFRWAELEQAGLYESITSSEFNIVTPENSVKWVNVQPEQGSFDFSDMDTLRDFADANGMEIHGHPLTWYKQNPLWLDTLQTDDVPDVLRAHIETVVGRYAGRISVWDVVNEALDHEGNAMRANPFFDAMGESYIDQAFIAARAADPLAELLYNEYDVGWLNNKSQTMFELVERLLTRNVPIDGVGLQMHIDHTFVHGEGFSDNMQRYADKGLSVYITEFDVKTLDPADYDQQAVVYEEILKRCLMQPACKAFQIWGVDDFHSWQPFFDPLPYDDDFNVKPAYYGMQRALSTQPVHLENCELRRFQVRSGSVYLTDLETDLSSSAASVQCAQVNLTGGFNSLRVRYRNPDQQSARLVIETAAGVQVAQLSLPPTLAGNDGDFQTLTVVTEAVLSGQQTLILRFDDSEGSGVGIGLDALLFESPQERLLVSSTTAGGALSWWSLVLLLGLHRLRR